MLPWDAAVFSSWVLLKHSNLLDQKELSEHLVLHCSSRSPLALRYFFQHSSVFAALQPDLTLPYTLLSARVLIVVEGPAQRSSKDTAGFLLISFWLRSQICISN